MTQRIMQWEKLDNTCVLGGGVAPELADTAGRCAARSNQAVTDRTNGNGVYPGVKN